MKSDSPQIFDSHDESQVRKKSKIVNLFDGWFGILMIALVLIGIWMGSSRLSYFYTKNQKVVVFEAPGSRPSILCLRLEFKGHKMDLLDAEWRANFKKEIEQANRYWNENLYGSFEQFQDPVISPILTLPQEAEAYHDNLDRIYKESVVVAKEAGIDTAQFDHVVMSFPRITNDQSAWGAKGKVWYPGNYFESHTFVHELGHSFGLGHAAVNFRDRRGTDPTAPPSSDPWFMMGDSTPLFLTPLPLPMRFQLKALGEEHVPLVELKSQEQTYRLYDLKQSLEEGQLTGLRIKESSLKTYWVSYLKKTESNLKPTEGFGVEAASGVIVQRSEDFLVESFPADSSPSGYHPEIYPERLGFQKGETFSAQNKLFQLRVVEEGVDQSGRAWCEVTISK